MWMIWSNWIELITIVWECVKIFVLNATQGFSNIRGTWKAHHVPENVAEILWRQSTGLDGEEDALRAKEEFLVALHGVLERLVGQNGRLAFQETLQDRVPRPENSINTFWTSM